MSDRTALRRLLLAAVLATVLATSGCSSGDQDRGSPDAWQQFDLWTLPPETGGSPDLATELPTLRGRALRTLRQELGKKLTWKLDVGTEARLGFRPLPEEPGCVYAVTVRGPQGGRQVLRETYPPSTDNPAREVTVALDVDAGRIELVLDVLDSGDGSCRHGQWASPLVTSRAPAAPPPDGERPNIVLIGADTLRADALGVYGRTPSVSPAIDRLAAESDVWLSAHSSGNNTNPSFISLMTGLYAKNHGVYDLKTPLPEGYVTLAMRLRDAGYATRAVASVAHLARFSGLERGFDDFVGSHRQFYAETAVDVALDWLQEIEGPYFLWIHLFDPHVPHNPPQPYDLGFFPETPPGMGPVGAWKPFREPGPRAFSENPRHLPGHPDLYAGEVAYLDHQVDRLTSFLDSRGALEHTLVALVADHGETLGERGHWFDHAGLHDNTTHVPLIVRWPGAGQGRRLPGLVQHFDLFPTLLEAAGVEVPPQDGVSLRRMASAGKGRPAVFSESAFGWTRRIRTAELEYAVKKAEDEEPIYYFYDLRNDPAELVNLAGSGLADEARLSDELAQWLEVRRSAAGTPQPLDVGEEEEKQLEALGYIQ